MNAWIQQLADLLAGGERVVAVTVVGVRGSAPREAGARMLVTEAETIGTIGGGQLEHQCTRLAVDALHGESKFRLERFPLGASMGQCCGGVVEVLFETFDRGIPSWLKALTALSGQRTPAMLVRSLQSSHTDESYTEPWVVTADDVFGEAVDVSHTARARTRLEAHDDACVSDGVMFLPVVSSDLEITLFGAGHVGSALVALLAGIDCSVRWVDSRPGFLRRQINNVRNVETAEPAFEVAAIPAGGFCLIMTHSHAMDFDILKRALRRDDLAYVGLIGSQSKRRRFVKRLGAEGLTAGEIARLTCPIGVEGISGKKPAEIAVAVAAEILRVHEAAAAELPAGVTRING